MANSYTLAYTLPDRAKFVPGRAVEEAEYQRLLDCTNLATAWNGTGCAFQASWDAADVEMPEGENNGSITVVGDPLNYAVLWRVVPPTDAHVALRVWVRVIGKGRVTFLGANDNQISHAIEAADPAGDGTDFVEVGDLDVEVATFVLMSVEGGLAGGDGTFAVVQVVGELLALDSPLPTAVITGYDDGVCTPFDPATALADGNGRRPLPAARGHQLARTLRTHLNGGQPRFAWAAYSWAGLPLTGLDSLSPLGHVSYLPTGSDRVVEAVFLDTDDRRLAPADPVAEVADGIDLIPVAPAEADPPAFSVIHAYRTLTRADGSYFGWVPSEAETRWGRPVRASTWQTWISALTRIIGLGIRRTTHHTYDYADLTTADSPLGLDQTIRTLHRPSPGTTNLWVGVRFQAAESSNPEQTLTIRALETDGDVIDAGVFFDYRQMGAGVDELGNGTLSYPAWFVHTGVRLDATAGTVTTVPRLLNISGYAGTLIEIEVETTDTRVIDIVVFDMPVGV